MGYRRYRIHYMRNFVVLQLSGYPRWNLESWTSRFLDMYTPTLPFR